MLKINSKKKKKIKKKDITVPVYYKLGADNGSIREIAILHFCILAKKKGHPISCCGNINKKMTCEAKPRTRLNNLKTCLEFSCLGLKTIIDTIKLTVLL